MSFILEAQKRDAANVDPAVAAQLAVEAHQRSRWRWIWAGVGAAVLLNVLIIGYFFNPFNDAGRQSGNRAATAPAAARELVVKPRERTGPNRTADRQRPDRATRPRANRPAPSSASRPSTPAANAGGGRVLTPEQAAAMDIALPQEPAEAAVPTPAFESSPPATAAAAAATTPKPEPATEPEAAPATPAPAPARSSDKKPVTLADLSPEDRAAFPKLEFSTHIFADDPALRAVVVNSKRLAEGESIGEMVLRAVTEDGIIVDYRGQRVAVSVVETWN